MISRILKRVKKLILFSIRTKLILIYLLIGMIPFLIVGIYLIKNSRQLEYQHRLLRLEEENKRVTIILFNTAYIATKITDNLFFDANLKSIISTSYDYGNDARNVYRQYDKLRTFLSDYPFLSDIVVYVNNPTMPTADRYIYADDKIQNYEWYKTAAAGVGEMSWHMDYFHSYNQDGYLMLVRKIPIVNSPYFGVLQIRVSHNFLRLMINDDSLQTLIALGDSEVLYSYSDNDIGTTIQSLSDNRIIIPTQGRINYHGKSLVAVQRNLEIDSQFTQYFKIITMDRHADAIVKQMTVVQASILILSVFLSFMLIFLFLISFSGRIAVLRKQMRKIADGDFAIIDSYKGHDELTEFYLDMRKTIHRTEELNKEIYSERLAKEKLAGKQQEMKFKILASQINPHFLFNTLESIRMKALSGGDTEVARIIKLLGKSMRYALDIQDTPVTLESELLHLQVYFDIHRFRFLDRIQYTIDADPKINPAQYNMLPILIQPIVENAIIHGMKSKKRDGKISINVFGEADTIIIQVADNGLGMTPERLTEIMELINHDDIQQAGHIGLHNVNYRIKLAYGDMYGLSIESVLNEGTRVTMTLPASGRTDKC